MMNEKELCDLRIKIAKLKGWDLIELTPTPDNKSTRTLSERTFRQFYAPGKSNDNPFWVATVINEWPEGWENIYLAREIPDWPRDVAAAFELVNESISYAASEGRAITWTLESCYPVEWIAKITDWRIGQNFTGNGKGPTGALAICRAYIAWKEAH
jgi:hypothetical protein